MNSVTPTLWLILVPLNDWDRVFRALPKAQQDLEGRYLEQRTIFGAEFTQGNIGKG